MTEGQKPIPTKQTLALVKALESKGIKLEVEYWDGHKHVDIYIPKAKLYIEINGLAHYTDPRQIIADLKRNHFSDGDDFFTMPITNQLIDKHLESIADAIVKVVAERSK
jgi:very-short-patch-repair endonuclease